MSENRCSLCGAANPENSPICRYCGEAQSQSAPAQNNSQPNPQPYPPQAGQPYPPQAGQPYPPQPGQTYQVNNIYQNVYSPKSKTTALILCILGFFGAAGIHRFYVGKPVSGILYLLTAGWCGIGTIIDLIMISAGTFKDGNGQPLV